MSSLLSSSSPSVGSVTAVIVATVITLLVAAAVFVAVVSPPSFPSPSSRTTKEGFSSTTVLNELGKDIDCATMQRHLMGSAALCGGLQLPRVRTKKVCVDGRCLDAQTLAMVENAPDEALAAFRREMRQVKERMARMARERRRGFDALADDISDSRDALSGLRDDIAEDREEAEERRDRTRENAQDSKKQPALGGGDEVYEKDGMRYHVFKSHRGVLKAFVSRSVDVFLVGGGAGGGGLYGGGGGYTKTRKNLFLKGGSEYDVVVGRGGKGQPDRNGDGEPGEASSFGDILEAPGGGAKTGRYGDGGSGGGLDASGSGCMRGDTSGGFDGSDGGSGWTMMSVRGVGRVGSPHDRKWPGRIAKGQGRTTRAFGESDGKTYAGGGSNTNCGGVHRKGPSGAGHNSGGPDAKPNTGSGGGGGRHAHQHGNGGSGIVIVRTSAEGVENPNFYRAILSRGDIGSVRGLEVHHPDIGNDADSGVTVVVNPKGQDLRDTVKNGFNLHSYRNRDYRPDRHVLAFLTRTYGGLSKIPAAEGGGNRGWFSIVPYSGGEGRRPSRFQISWNNITSDRVHGGFVALLDDKDRIVFCVGNRSPQIQMFHGGGSVYITNFNYNTWCDCRVEMNWEDRTLDAAFSSKKGTWKQHAVPMMAGKNVQRIAFSNMSTLNGSGKEKRLMDLVKGRGGSPEERMDGRYGAVGDLYSDIQLS